MQLLWQIVVEFWDVLAEMAPFLLFGFLVAGILSVFLSARLVERHLGGHGIWPMVKAAVFGIPIPLCSCGVIPVSASLRRHGAGKPAVTSFLIATPQDGVDSIAVTYSLMGGAFALLRPLFALVSAMVGGLAVALFDRDATKAQTTEESVEAAEAGHDACEAQNKGNRFVRIFTYGFDALPRDIGRSLLIGLLIAGVISAVMPENLFVDTVGEGIWQILILMAAGIPVYVCATASVPIAAALVLQGGASPGAALAFLMTGPATNAATIVTIWRVMSRRTAIIYVLAVALCALGSGLAIDAIFAAEQFNISRGMPQMIPMWAKYAAAVALLIVLGLGAVRGEPSEEFEQEAGSQAAELDIKGMHCSHCAESISAALRETPGVESARVLLDAGKAEVRGENLDTEQLASAVRSLGYDVTDARVTENEHSS
ncbi:MAG: SO_0444 family Cu/Zn efflux transporter [Phycisphaerae bacterium]